MCRDVDIRSPKPVDVLCISAVSAGAYGSAMSVRAPTDGPRRGCGHRCSRPNRRLRATPCRRSPLKYTAFRVVVGRAIHTRGGVLARSPCIAHHRNSQRFEWSWIALFTPGSARFFDRGPSLTVEFHSVSIRRELGCPHLNRHIRSVACRRSPSKFTGFLVSGGDDIHTRICAAFSCATACSGERQSRASARAGTPIRAEAGTRREPAAPMPALP